jgi:hypothetical protein
VGIQTYKAISLGLFGAQSKVARLTGLDFRIFKQNTHGEGDVVGLGNAVVVLLDKFDGFAISDEFLEEGGNEFGAGEAVR